MLVPLLASCGQGVVWLILLLKEGVREGADIGAVLELRLCDLGRLLKVAVPVEKFVNLVLDLCLQVEVFQQTRNLLLNIRYLAAALHDLVLDRLFDSPEGVAILDVFEDEFALLSVAQIHVGCTSLQSWLSVFCGCVHLSVRSYLFFNRSLSSEI